MKQVDAQLGYLDDSDDPATEKVAAQTTLPSGGGDTSYLVRLSRTIRESLSQLDVHVQQKTDSGTDSGTRDNDGKSQLIEQMAFLIHDSMSASARRYHNVQHVFDVAEGVSDDPIAVLAALFHDSVYFHVDGGLSDLQLQHLNIFEDAFARRDKLPEYRVNGGKPDNCDTLLRMVECIFGYPLNTVVTHRNGLNEFLSAVVCVRLLETLLPLRTLAEIACCIEATIPFRPNTVDEDGKDTSPSDRLYLQLELANTKFDLQMNSQDMVRAVQRSVRVANQDVGNFGTDDVLWFLDNTWDLLPETNEALRQQAPCTVHDFQLAVFKMYGFFNFLQPEVVFQQYKGIPSAETLIKRQELARKNLALGRAYVGAKLLALSVLAAFAELTGGGDAPVSLFMGDFPSHHDDQQCRCPLFPDGPGPPAVKGDELNATVYKILMDGRRSETSFDIRQSPLAAYLYGHLGDCRVSSLLSRPHAKWDTLYPMTRETAFALLKELPKDCVKTLGESLASVATSRRTALEDRIQEIITEG